MKGWDRRCYNLSKPLNYDPSTQPPVLGTAEFRSKLLWFLGKSRTLGGGVICLRGPRVTCLKTALSWSNKGGQLPDVPEPSSLQWATLQARPQTSPRVQAWPPTPSRYVTGWYGSLRRWCETAQPSSAADQASVT